MGAIALSLVAAFGGAVAVAQRVDESPNCGPYDGEIVESDNFTAYDAQLSHLPAAKFSDIGQNTTSVPAEYAVDSISGVPRRWAVNTGNGGSVQYFSDRQVDAESSLWDFQEAGGIQFEALPLGDAGMSIEELGKVLDERGVHVQVGDSPGVVVWADPEAPSGQRLHHVYWEDSDGSYGLIVDATAPEAVTMAREVACSR